jgi:glycosyltransferase involved in cell wall biosynthesis
MAMSKPIVSSKQPGISEILVNEFNGILREKNRPEAFADAIECLYRNPKLRAKLGKNARRCVRWFDWEYIHNYKLSNYPDMEG